MDTDILMGIIVGFFLGIGFTILFTNIIAWRVESILGTGFSKRLKKRKDKSDDDTSNYWKPKGWEPDN